MLFALRVLMPCLLSFTVLASSPKIPHDFPERDSAGANLMLKKCSACHGVPSPSLHPAAIWPSVVYRMQMRMQTKGQVPLSHEELDVVIDYLQRHGAVSE